MTIPNFTITINKPTNFATAIKAIYGLVTEVNLRFTKENMTINALDPANVGMVEFSLTRTSSYNWTVPGDFKVGINLCDLHNVLRRLQPKDTLIITNAEKRLRITLGTNRHYDLLTSELTDNKTKPVKDMKVKLAIRSRDLQQQILDADMVGETIKFVAHESTFTVSSGNDDTCHFSTTNNGFIIYTLNDHKPIQTKYSAEYLKKMVEATPLSSTVTLEYSKDWPLRLTYKAPQISLAFTLAPRVDNE